ncbi:hypothetical protein CBD41_06575 [bacterium TMED181]|nr:hypothetical protein [Planctomycetota bacterium]OUW43914.1 MAG: hypothetical protein CBD41_06575 [bacterium TMED181]
MPVPALRVFSASWPGKIEPWRARFIRDLHVDLSKDFKTEVLAPAVHPEDPLEEEHDGLKLRRFRYRSGGKSPRQGGLGLLESCSWILSARKALKKWGGPATKGVTLVHWGIPGAFLASSFCDPVTNPMVVWCHGSDVHRHGRKAIGAHLLRSGLRSAQRVLAASQEMADELEKAHGIQGVEVLPVGIDDVFQMPAKVGRRNPGLKLLWVGERLESKGYGRVLRGVQKAQDHGVPLTLDVIGEGPLTGTADFVPNLHGARDSRGVCEAMDLADLLLLPSHAEGTPLVIQEAKARSLPVAATPVGGIPDLFEGDLGWFSLQSKEEDALESEICDLLVQLDQSPELLQQKQQQLRKSSIPVIYRKQSGERLAAILQEVHP